MAPLDPRDIGIYNDRKKSEIDVYIDNEWNGDRSWLYKKHNHEQKHHGTHSYCIRKILVSIKSIFGKA